MKKILFTMFLMVLGTSAFAQVISTGSSYIYLGYVDGYNEPYFNSVDGVLYACSNSGNNRYLVKYPANRTATSYTIDPNCIRICKGAFEGCKYLQEINIPSSVEYIGDDAFSYCM